MCAGRWQPELVALVGHPLRLVTWPELRLPSQREDEDDGDALPSSEAPADGSVAPTAAGVADAPVAWVHVPKTGQSFLASLALYGCDGIAPVRRPPRWPLLRHLHEWLCQAV